MSRMFLRRTLRRLLPRSVALQIRRAWLGRRIARGKGRFEDDVPLLETYVNSTDICWDTGANNGTYTLHLSKLARKVFAFEPVPHSAGILQDVKRLACLDNVVVSGVALSDRVGRANMTVPVDGFYGGFYLVRDAHNQLVEVLVRVHERNYWFFPPGSTRSPAAVKPGARSTGPDVRA